MILPFGCVPDTLSTHFELKDLLVTATGFDNTPHDFTVVSNLREICVEVLEKVHLHFKAPIKIHSGYRSEKVNRAVSRSPNSAHRFGCAVDFSVPGFTTYEVATWVEKNIQSIGELILEEYVPQIRGSGWVHYALPRSKRNWIKTKFQGSNVFHDGIILGLGTKEKRS